MLSEDLLARVRERANDPERCSDVASISGQTMDLETMLGQLGGAGEHLRAMQGQMSGFMGQFASIMQGFGVMNPLPRPAEAKAAQRKHNQVPPPASGEKIAEAEAALGFALPDELKQLYARVADGRFGPGQGLYSLDELVREYKDFTSEPFGPQGQPWPANLISICHDDPGEICLDRESGKVIFWDAEELVEGPSNKYWLRSFKDEADDLAALLEKWVGEPTVMERMQGQRDEVMTNPMQTHINNMIDCCSRMTPEEREAMGFGGEDWQDKIRQRYSNL